MQSDDESTYMFTHNNLFLIVNFQLIWLTPRRMSRYTHWGEGAKCSGGKIWIGEQKKLT